MECLISWYDTVNSPPKLTVGAHFHDEFGVRTTKFGTLIL
jgi:hypothetical protein